ncbi:MAG: PAS domain-containing protein [Xanthobacteraceae bacterium]
MKHPSIRELYDYWNARRGGHAVPDRSDIEPGAIRHVLADTFILSAEQSCGYPFRVAGTRVCAIFGRELKNEPYLALWNAEASKAAHDLLMVVTREAVAIVASATGTGIGKSQHALELLLLPLSHRGATDLRILGALTPAGGAHWLGETALERLTLGSLRYLGPERAVSRAPAIAPALPAGRPRRGLMVYDGGQA